MALEIKNAIHAMCILVPGAIGPGTFAANRGFQTAGTGVPVRNGNSDYTLTFDQPIDAAESVAIVTGNLAIFTNCTYTRPTDATIRIYAWAQAGGADPDTTTMHVIVYRATL